MTERGWYSGDMHVHAPLRQVATLMEAEDLNVAIPLSLWRMQTSEVRRDPDLQEYLNKADIGGAIQEKANHLFTVVNEELETRSSALLVSRLKREPLPLDYPMAEFARKAHERGALVDSEKDTSLEFPVVMATGGCDFVGLANNHFWRSGCYLDPWGSWPDLLPRQFPVTCSGFALAGSELYYAALNLNYPLKISAGSAYGVHPVPLGWSRVYVHVNNKFNAENWFRALEQGHSFVTTGPMILLKANGLEPGDAYRGRNFPLHVQVELELLSRRPVTRAEVTVNGQVHSVPLHLRNGNLQSYQASLAVMLKTSSWIAARWLERVGETVDLAHSGPIYFWDQNQPISVPQRESKYYLQRVNRMIQEIESGKSETYNGPTSIVISGSALRIETLKYFNQALEVYRRKLHDAD
jgi:hypothetical protein